jgi:hypothetical protein
MNRYIKFLLLAAGACGLLASVMWLRGRPTNLGAALFSFVLGAAVTSLITVQLPIFRRYYSPVSLDEMRRYRGPANEQAAPVMASLVAAVIVGLVLYVLGVEDIVEPAFISAVCAGVIGHYHRRTR